MAHCDANAWGCRAGDESAACDSEGVSCQHTTAINTAKSNAQLNRENNRKQKWDLNYYFK